MVINTGAVPPWPSPPVPSPLLSDAHHWPIALRPATSIRPSPLKSPSTMDVQPAFGFHTAKVDCVKRVPSLVLSSHRPLDVKLSTDSYGTFTGGFTATVTVTSNVSVTEPLSAVVARSLSRPPSSTVTVIVAVPATPTSGVKARLPVASADV